MSHFDEKFEDTRLSMLARQYPEIVQERGRVVFRAADNEDHLSDASWTLEDDLYKQANESGFKVHLMELLNNFIEYRGQCDRLSEREGIIIFGNGKIIIEWVSANL